MREVKMAGRWKAKYMFYVFMVQKKNETNIQSFDQTRLVNREFNTWTKNILVRHSGQFQTDKIA